MENYLWKTKISNLKEKILYFLNWQFMEQDIETKYQKIQCKTKFWSRKYFQNIIKRNKSINHIAAYFDIESILIKWDFSR